jgi:hypothetical protein
VNPTWELLQAGAGRNDAPPVSDLKIAAARSKPPLQLIPLHALIGLARVIEYGAKKYAPGNWVNNPGDGAAQLYIGACLRHLQGMQDDGGVYRTEGVEWWDEESGLPHIDHAIASLVMLREIMVVNDVMKADPGPGAGV